MKCHQFQQALAMTLFSLAVESKAADQEWTRFRGPNGTGRSDTQGIPAKWTRQSIKWKIELLGTGHSSPVVWRDRILVTSADETTRELSLFCLSTNAGRILWRQDIPLGHYARHRFNAFASSTPAVDAQGIYFVCLSPDGYKAISVTHAGERRWEKNLGDFESQHGAGGSLMLADGQVVLAKDQDGDSFIVALDAKDGQVRWQTALEGGRADYGTPCLYQADGKSQLIFSSMEDGVVALNPVDGKVAWQLPKVFTQRCVSSPVIASGLIIGSCGSGGGGNYVAAVRPPKSPGAKAEIAYTIRRSAPYVPTSVALGELLFLWSDGGVVTCVLAATGEIKWQERVGGNFFASPICVDGQLIGVSTAGEVIVLEASDRFRELARHSMQEATHATPAVSGGRLYLRTVRHLWAVGG